MKREFKNHFTPLFLISILIISIWVSKKVPNTEYVYLILGLITGSFFLDIDHFIYWFYLKPNTEESKLAQAAIKNKKIFEVLELLEENHKSHTNMVFHHFFFQVILCLTSLFVYTSTKNIFILSFLLSLNIHLLVDEIDDYIYHPKHLQDWLFAREEKQLTVENLKYYLLIFVTFSIIFTLLLINSRL